jgi:hypothetical protein
MLICSITALAAIGCGCSSAGGMRGGDTSTSVEFNRNNYEVIKAGAQGKSYGFRLLGVIPITSPNYADAKANLYKDVKTPLDGKAVALANQTWDHSDLYLVLFSIPRVTLTADVVQFVGNGGN